MTNVSTRGYWVSTLEKIALPVLGALAQGRLRQEMPVDAALEEKVGTSYLEAFGRTMTGIAPWLCCKGLEGEEERRRARLAQLAREGLRRAVEPGGADRMDFLDSPAYQPIVDAAFLAHGLLRAWDTLWEPCDSDTRRMTLDAMKGIRRRKPWYNNWLLFSAMVEALLYRAGEDFDEMRVDYALHMFDQTWYAGDGLYSDGERFHMDYYNSYVIQPMLLQILDTVGDVYPEWSAMRAQAHERAARYAAIQERLIAPDGSFPVVGRSICYRMGAFHLLADVALRGELPVPPAAVRCALTAVIRRCVDSPGNFTPDGWLTVGLCGHQPSLRERYITTGSLYLCTGALLPLGLGPENEFWSAPDEDWSGKAVWSGKDLPADHALD